MQLIDCLASRHSIRYEQYFEEEKVPMKRFRILLVAALAALFTVAFASIASAAPAHATTCTWRVVQSANIYYGVTPGQPQPNQSADGVVYLWRDGCGDIKATLTSAGYADQTDVLLQDASGHIIGTQGTTSTAVYSGYAGVSVSAGGVLVHIQGDAAIVGVSYTAYDSGS